MASTSNVEIMQFETAVDAERLGAKRLLQAEVVHYSSGGSGSTNGGHPSSAGANKGLLYRDVETSALVCFVSHDNVAYKQGDCVYVDSQRPDQPYYVAAVQAFKMTKRDQLNVLVKWYYRPCELPELLYDSLLQERIREEHYLPPDDAQSALREKRELFISDAIDTYPVSALRGKSYVHHYKDSSLAREFDPQPDHFYYILGYNPETNRLASIQGEIRVGHSYQAKVPDVCLTAAAAACGKSPADGAETLLWTPERISDGDLIMYLQAARSMAAFAGICDSGSTDDVCVAAAARDQTTINAMDALHRNNYDTGRALQELVKSPLPLSIEKRWCEEETKKFVRGLKQFGKNFFRIQKDLLPQKQTTELVEFYYLWKKHPTAHHQRPRPRHRRVQSANVFRRSKANGANSRAANSAAAAAAASGKPTSSAEFLDLSSASENGSNSDDSPAAAANKDSPAAAANGAMSGYACHHCFTTNSKNWHHAGKKRTLLCAVCRVYFKKYGELRPVDRPRTPPAALFKPVKEDADEALYQPGIRTRRSGKEAPCSSSSSSSTTTAASGNSAGGRRRANTPPDGGRAKNGPVAPKSPDSASSSSGGSSVATDTGKKTPKARAGGKRKRRGDKENAAAASPEAVNGKRQPNVGKRAADWTSAAGDADPDVQDDAPASKTPKTVDTSIEESIASVVRGSLSRNAKARAAESLDDDDDAAATSPCPSSTSEEEEEEAEEEEDEDDERSPPPSSVDEAPAVVNAGSAARLEGAPPCSLVLSGLLSSVKASPVVEPTVEPSGACSVIRQHSKVSAPSPALAEQPRHQAEAREDPLLPPAAKEPAPKIDDNTEFHRSKNAVFRRHWNRGWMNSCARTDLVFITPPGSPLARRRQREAAKRHAASVDVKEEKRERPPSIVGKLPCTPTTGSLGALRCSPVSGMLSNFAPFSAAAPNAAAAAAAALQCLGIGALQQQDLPALQRLKEYASAAALTYTPGTAAFYQAALYDPVLQHRILNGLYGPIEKERLEHELHERQTTDLLKRDYELASKPLLSLSSANNQLGHNSTANGAASGLGMLGMNAGAESARQVLGAGGAFPGSGQFSPVSSGGGGSSAVNFAAGAALPFGIDQATLERMHADRLVAERMQLERLAALYPANPLLRLEIDRLSAALSALATQHHTHSHTHSHTHLHIHPSSAASSCTQEATTTSSSMAPSHHPPHHQQHQMWPPHAAPADQLLQQYPALFRPTVLPTAGGGLACLDNGLGLNPAALMATLGPPGFNVPAGAVLDPLSVERLQQIQQEHLQRQMLLERDRLMTAQHHVAMQHNEMMRRLQQEGSLLSTAAGGAAPGTVGNLLRAERSPFEKQ